LKVPVLNVLWRNTVMSALVRFPGPDWAPVIRYRNHMVGPSARPSRLPHVICAPPGNFSISHQEK